MTSLRRLARRMAGRRGALAGSVRRRLVTTILLVTAGAVVAFGVPLAVAVDHIERARAVLSLERQADRVLALVPDELLARGRLFFVPAGSDDTEDQGLLGIYTSQGRRVAGSGPTVSALAVNATRQGRQATGTEAGQLTVVLPLRSDRPSATAIRAALPLSQLSARDRHDWLLMTGLGALVVLAAGVVGTWQARRLADPLDALADDARALGEGDFTIQAKQSRLREVDAASRALQATAARLGRLLERERAFSTDASHQLRTPLTALRLALEAAPLTPGARLDEVCTDAVRQVDRLEDTINRLLAVARDVEPIAHQVDLNRLLAEVQRDWAPIVQGHSRRLVVDAGARPTVVRASQAGLRHVLDVLIDNALQHGAGNIALRALSAGPGVSLEVTDEGPGVTGDPERIFERRVTTGAGHGIGLALARALVEADGGRLLLRHAGPHPVFAVVLPPEREPADAHAPEFTAAGQ